MGGKLPNSVELNAIGWRGERARQPQPCRRSRRRVRI